MRSSCCWSLPSIRIWEIFRDCLASSCFPNEAVYALILLVLARVFSYAFALQREYEQTV
jgi:hypothetical protein